MEKRSTVLPIAIPAGAGLGFFQGAESIPGRPLEVPVAQAVTTLFVASSFFCGFICFERSCAI